MKRIICYILTLSMLISVLCVTVAADTVNSVTYDNDTWTYDPVTKTLRISGDGAIKDRVNDPKYDIPDEWYDAVEIIVEQGITEIGYWAFTNFDKVRDLTLPDGLESMGEGTLYGMKNLEYIVFPSTLKTLYFPFHTDPPPAVMVFRGDAPELVDWPSVNEFFISDIYYPVECTTWTDEYKAKFGTGVRWNGKSNAKETVSDVFNDVLAGAWYTDGIQYAYDNGIMNGMGNGSFNPQGNVTREQVMQVLLILESPATGAYNGNTGFKDVKLGYWYSRAVTWARANEITSGVGEKIFGLGQFVTREQLATFIKNYLVYTGCEISCEGDLSAFADAAKVSDWAVDAMKFCVSNGIIKGRDASILDPKGYATRAELAQMLSQFLESGFLYRVDFDDNNADSCTAEFKYIASGALFGNVPHAEKEGFLNAGWWYEDIKIQSNTRLEISGHITVTKRWCNGHRVSFNPKGGEMERIDKYIDKGEPLGELPIPTKEGYIFEGWLFDYDGESYIVTEETVFDRDYGSGYLLKAQWRAIDADNENGGI